MSANEKKFSTFIFNTSTRLLLSRLNVGNRQGRESLFVTFAKACTDPKGSQPW